MDKLSLNVLDLLTYWWWRPYVSRGRGQLRVGVRRNRKDSIYAGPEYRWVGITWQL